MRINKPLTIKFDHIEYLIIIIDRPLDDSNG